MIAPLFVATGLFWVSHIPVNGTFWGNVAPGMILMGLGLGATFVSVTIAATSGVSQRESGLASGLLNTSQQIGGSLGLAILTGISTSGATRYLKNIHGSHSAYDKTAAAVHGYHDGYLVAAGFAVIASILATVIIKNIRAKTDPSHGEVAAAV
jgi:MFS family permease